MNVLLLVIARRRAPLWLLAVLLRLVHLWSSRGVVRCCYCL